MRSRDGATHDLARRIFELTSESQEGESSAEIVCGKLRIILTRFAGVDGFKAFFRRALRSPGGETSELQAVTLQPDGSIHGLREIKEEEAVDFVARQLEILVILIGERITLRLLADEWPELLQ